MKRITLPSGLNYIKTFVITYFFFFATFPYFLEKLRRFPFLSLFKVAEHSFQVPMPNSPLLLNHLCFGARVLQESRLTTEVFILAFWLGCVLLPWQRGWLKTRLKNFFLLILKNPVVRFFSSFAHCELTLNPFCQHYSNKILT